jgi:glycosyltransferase involved in cell wall biosynthesis
MSHPKVSIVLPTFNRARFMPQAFQSIASQTWTDWELIVIDDGSTDETRALVEKFAASGNYRVHYIYQANMGGAGYGARNTGLDHARGAYIAFFDSDDYWLPHHLADCVAGLESQPEVDWVYGACRVADYASGREIEPNTFYTGGKPRPFLGLRTRQVGELRIIEDPACTSVSLLCGLFNGLQNSVVRRQVFKERRFHTEYYNCAEDQLAIIRSLADGARLAYFMNVHVTVNYHEANSTSAAVNVSLNKRLAVQRALVRGYEDLRAQVALGGSEKRALARRLGDEYFWGLGYSLLWQLGEYAEACRMFRRGLLLQPWNVSFWKTYLAALAKRLFLRKPAGLAVAEIE